MFSIEYKINQFGHPNTGCSFLIKKKESAFYYSSSLKRISYLDKVGDIIKDLIKDKMVI